MIKVHLKTGKLNALSYFLISLIILSLTACTSNRLPHYKGGSTKRDAAPRGNVDVSMIPDAVPKVEPRSRYGNPKSYVVKGKRYHVLKSAKGYNKVGYASWYGTRFHGKLTSSREPYNLYHMVAASPHLPLPTYVKVTNLENGKSVILKVIDRGPFKRGRIMDLSYGAAKRLGYAHKGVAKVRVTAIDPVQWAKEQRGRSHKHTLFASLGNQNKASSSQWMGKQQLASAQSFNSLKMNQIPKEGAFVHLQVGAFSNRNNAEQLKVRLAKLLQHPVKVNRDIRSNSPLYRVQITSSREDSSRLQKLLQRHGLSPLVSATG